MPKKFKGENSKASVARERKAAQRESEEQERKKREEDEYWRDDDKHVTRKQGRKDEREKRKQDQLERKQEARLLLEQEEEELGGKQTAVKVTRAQIIEAEEQRRRESESIAAAALPKGVVIEPTIDQNPNHLLRDRLESGELEARTVEEAIEVLGLTGEQQQKQDKHPEKRLKAAYAAFEERELPLLKAENLNLRLSQVKQLVRKKWMKSPENPMNNF